MRILFDQGTPVPLRAFLIEHEVSTAAQQGWERLRNGELILAAEHDGFEALLTTDKNLRYQQNLTDRQIAIVLISRQQWPHLREHVTLVIPALRTLKPGQYLEVMIPEGTQSQASDIE